MFGASRPALGVLVVPTSSDTSPDDIRARLHKANSNNPSYAQIPDLLLVILPPGADLPKTSKGSVVRPRALVQYKQIIDEAYDRLEMGREDAVAPNGESGSSMHLKTVDEVQHFVRGVILDSLRKSNKPCKGWLGDDDDLFDLGVDSLQAMTVRSTLQKASKIGCSCSLPFDGLITRRC